MDDVTLYRSGDANPTVFTDTFVNRLKELNPGILRDWDNHQFGNTLDNELAVPWARKTTGFRPDERVAIEYAYSLHEFLELCQEVGAEPWHVIPPTSSPADLVNLLEYLAGTADGAHPYADRRATLGRSTPWTDIFPIIHLEFGNELWGSADPSDPFWGASAKPRMTASLFSRPARTMTLPDSTSSLEDRPAGLNGRMKSRTTSPTTTPSPWPPTTNSAWISTAATQRSSIPSSRNRSTT